MDELIFMLLMLILVIFTINSFFLQKLEKNYIFIFNIWWLFWLGISYLNIGQFYKIELKTYIYIYTGIIMFNLPLYFFINNPQKLKPNLNIKKIKILMLIECCFIIINLFYLIKMILIIKSSDNYWMVRFIFYGISFDGINLKLFSNSANAHLYNLFRTISLTNFLIGISLLEKNKKILVLSFFNVILYCLISGGREFISYLIIIGIFSFKAKIIKKNIKLILLLILCTLVMTFFRQASLKKVFMTIITYYSGAIAYFDYLLKHNNDKFYNGELLFSGIIGPIKFLLRYIGFKISNSSLSEVGTELMKFVQLSDTNSFFKFYNALATAFYWQYKDFGYFGIVVINLLLGIFYRIFYKKLEIRNLNHIAISSYLEYLMIQSIFGFKHIDFFSILPLIIYIMILERRKSVSTNFNNSL